MSEVATREQADVPPEQAPACPDQAAAPPAETAEGSSSADKRGEAGPCQKIAKATYHTKDIYSTSKIDNHESS